MMMIHSEPLHGYTSMVVIISKPLLGYTFLNS
jgi:hypothetical protein